MAYVNQVVAHVDGRAVGGRVPVQGHPDHRLHQQGADRDGEGGAGRRAVRRRCRCCRSPRRSAGPRVFPAGEVKIKDVAGLYIFDNTLEAVVLTGAQVRDYLEFSAKYFRDARARRPGRPGDDQRPAVPDYNYDIALRRRLRHRHQPSRSAQRITRAVRSAGAAGADGRAVRGRGEQLPAQRRRQLPGTCKTPGLQRAAGDPPAAHRLGAGPGPIDPADFFQPNWRLVRAGVPVF